MLHIALAAATAWSAPTTATLYVDAAHGDDSNDGSAAHPFQTAQHCQNQATPGTTCVLRAGTYRESISINKNSIAFRADGAAVLSGLDLLDLKWERDTRPCTWRAALNASVPQLFYDGNMMVEARWPNIYVNNVGDASMSPTAWRKVGDNTTYGTVHDPALRTNFSWDGALATLNVAHQWNTWTRVVSNHSRSAGTFDYPQDLPGLAGYDPILYPAQAHIWDGCNQAKCNQYFLSGKLEALDAPGEWFHDGATLYFYPPTCTAPTAAVEVKARNYAVWVGTAKEDLSFEGLTFQGATLSLKNCTRCTLTNLTLDHPTYDREIKELNTPTGHVAATLVAGQHIALKNIVVTQSNNNGLLLNGYNVSLDNCVVSYTDWVGALQYKPLGVIGNQISVTRCTVRDFGNAGITTAIPNVAPAAPGKPQQPPEPMAGRRLEVAYTHIYNGARVGEDTAALYSGGWAAAGTVWHHNWVHDTTEKCIRFDDQSENATIHHNVIYNCGEPKFDASSGLNSGLGLVAKGDGHIIYANTIFAANFSEMCLSSCIEKEKKFRRQYPRICVISTADLRCDRGERRRARSSGAARSVREV